MSTIGHGGVMLFTYFLQRDKEPEVSKIGRRVRRGDAVHLPPAMWERTRRQQNSLVGEAR